MKIAAENRRSIGEMKMAAENRRSIGEMKTAAENRRSIGEMKIAAKNRSTRRITYHTGTLPTNPIRTGLGSNPTLRGQRPKANRLSHGTAMDRANK
jgi:hypothetical protein